jgi:hypothetical protein
MGVPAWFVGALFHVPQKLMEQDLSWRRSRADFALRGRAYR